MKAPILAYGLTLDGMRERGVNRTCNDHEHEAARRNDRLVRAELRADREYGTPCLVCGAPIYDRFMDGHDEGCMAVREHLNDAGTIISTQHGTPCSVCAMHGTAL